MKSDDISSGGNSCNIWFQLPQDITHKILEFLSDPDLLGAVTMIAKNWIVPTEHHYQSICHSIYIDQSSKQLLNVSKFCGSWKNMLVNRPRVRLNGFYSLQTAYWKPPSNDAFWEERRHEFIEVKFYRHVRFLRGKRVLYSLDNFQPNEVYTQLKNGLPIPKRIYEGSYCVIRDEVLIEIPTHYCIIKFKMKIRDADDRYVGKYNVLRIVEHTSKALVDGDSGSEYQIKLPSNTDLLFYRHWAWE